MRTQVLSGMQSLLWMFDRRRRAFDRIIVPPGPLPWSSDQSSFDLMSPLAPITSVRRSETCSFPRKAHEAQSGACAHGVFSFIYEVGPATWQLADVHSLQ